MHQTTGDSKDLRHFEKLASAKGHGRIAGVDEVGRGPLAGPVVAAAVILSEDVFSLPLDDSKSLSAARREELSQALQDAPDVQIGLGIVPPAEIDQINILRATHLAMRQALEALNPAADFALVDGLAVPGLPVPAKFIVKGDGRSASIAAASIVAKVHRDAIMTQLDTEFPGYGFARHKGYGTKEHLEALNELGPCPAHRRSFEPVRRVDPDAQQQLEFSLPD